MNKQTAVEWLIEQYSKKGYIGLQDELQAKQMEREQVEDAYLTDRFPCSDEDARQYFEDTYIIKK